MPLHLLGKKSWNVYNPENIARVQRDEAQAKAQEEEEERLMQEEDAGRRIKILRGERPPTPPPPPRSSPPQQDKKSHREAEAAGGYRKRRRIAGEDDTDRDIRFAREKAQFADGKKTELVRSRMSDAPLEDGTGHINLFPSEERRAPVEKNAEAEKEAADKKRKYEDQVTMRFSNAAGFRQSVGQKPWYSSSGHEVTAPEPTSGKDVWGNEDPMRKQREMARMDVNDPLAAIKKGVRQLKTVEQERKKWNDERSRELEALKAADRQRSHRQRRRSRSVSEDSLEGFRLDSSPDRRRDDKDRERSSRRHHHRNHRERSRDRSRRKHHSPSRSRSHRHHRYRHDSKHDGSRSSRRP